MRDNFRQTKGKLTKLRMQGRSWLQPEICLRRRIKTNGVAERANRAPIQQIIYGRIDRDRSELAATTVGATNRYEWWGENCVQRARLENDYLMGQSRLSTHSRLCWPFVWG